MSKTGKSHTNRSSSDQRRKVDLRSIDAVLREIDRLHNGGWRRVGQWDLAQACDHLASTVRYSLEGWPSQGNWFVKTLVAPGLRWYFLRTRYVPVGYPTHPDAIPKAGLNEAEAVER